MIILLFMILFIKNQKIQKSTQIDYKVYFLSNIFQDWVIDLEKYPKESSSINEEDFKQILTDKMNELSQKYIFNLTTFSNISSGDIFSMIQSDKFSVKRNSYAHYFKELKNEVKIKEDENED